MRKLSVLIVIASVLLFVFVLNFASKNKSETNTTNESQTTNSASAIPESKQGIVAQNLKVPWALTFLPDKSILFTERVGNVKRVGTDGTTQTVFEVPDVKVEGEGGLHGITLHPQFEQNQYVYLYYTYQALTPTLNKVVRYKYQNGTLQEDKIVLDKIPGSIFHNGGRIKFGPDNFLYVTTGDAQEPSLAQDTKSLGGKILRVTDEGQPAPGNPFDNEVYSYGHRNPQGITWDEQGNLWEAEHGPSANDEINKIEIGKNYGWPEVVGTQTREGVVSPYTTSGAGNTWAPGDLIVLGNKIYFAGLRGSAIFSFDINTPNKVSAISKDVYGRIRELILGPDNSVYFSTSNQDGRGIPRDNDDKIIRLDSSSL